MKKHLIYFIAGLLVGAVAFSAVAVYAESSLRRSTAAVYVNGVLTDIAGYNVADQNYYRLADLAERMNFDLSWDGSKNAVYIETEKEYSGVHEIESVNTGSKNFASDKSYRPGEGSVLLADDGTSYVIKKQKPVEQPLPEPLCDWSQFPLTTLPKMEVRHYKNESGDVLFVKNLYETKRMQYTIYNLASQNEQTWENGRLKTYRPWKSAEEQPVVRVELGQNMTEQAQVFWPYRDSELEKVFESAPLGTWSVVAWDQYIDGEYHATQYYVEHL